LRKSARRRNRCMLSRPNPRPGHPLYGLSAEPLATLGTAGGNHLTAARGRDPGAESMPPLAHQLARLIGPLHDLVSAERKRASAPETGSPRAGIPARRARFARLYGRRGVRVNATATALAACSHGASKDGESR
jgi:hypothetical protein